jgi:hypothetical protein
VFEPRKSLSRVGCDVGRILQRYSTGVGNCVAGIL